MKNLETEFKWEGSSPRSLARARQIFGTLGKLSLPAYLRICDTYLDHADERFAKEKIAFRVRKVNQKWEATFKTRSEIKNGKAVRREETLALPHVRNLAQALAFLTRKKMWKKLDARELQKRFVLKNRRQSFNLAYKKCVAELALDNFCIFVCGREVKMKEIELELKRGSMQDFEELAAQFTAKSKFAFSDISKVRTAETLRKLWSKQ